MSDDGRSIRVEKICTNFKKGEMAMSEHEKKIVKAFAEALPGMSDFDKGYVLGMSEQIAAKRKETDATGAEAETGEPTEIAESAKDGKMQN